MTKEEDVTHRFLNGEAALMQKLYSKNYYGVEKYILKNNGTKDEAKDIFQQGLLVMYTLLKKEKLIITSFDSYLFSICKNLWIKQSVKNRVTKLQVNTLIDESPDLAVFHLEQLQWHLYKEKFNLLKDSCKSILKMVLNNISYAKIAKELNYANENAARQKVFRCKTKLFKLIQTDPIFKKLKNK